MVDGELEGVEVEAGAAGGDLVGREGVHHLGESDADGFGVCGVGKLERFGFWGWPFAGVKTQVEVAVGVVAERGRMALGAGGHDVAAFGEHEGTPTPPTLVLRGSRFDSVGCGMGGAACF